MKLAAFVLFLFNFFCKISREKSYHMSIVEENPATQILLSCSIYESVSSDRKINCFEGNLLSVEHF